MNHVFSILIKVSESNTEDVLKFLESIKYSPAWYQTKNGITIIIASIWKSDVSKILLYAKQNKLEIRKVVSL